MRKIILFTSVSLDGFIEGPDGELDWQLVDEELHRHFNEQLAPMGAFLCGRVMYELRQRRRPAALPAPLTQRPDTLDTRPITAGGEPAAPQTSRCAETTKITNSAQPTWQTSGPQVSLGVPN